MSSGPRLIAVLAAALVVVTATAFAVQEQDRRDDLAVAPGLSGQRYVAAELRVVPPTSRSAGRAAGQVDPGWLSVNAAASGIPATALRAYARAQLTDAGGCGIGWTTLAAVGWVESQHGTLGGRTLLEDGHSSTPILGPALDGTGEFAAIRSSAASRAWHGDERWEHAVGPMQFLPGTWAAWGTDGDRDGTSDPLDLDDAAAATARYLCAGGHDLGTGAGWSAAVFSYNHSRAYVDDVYAAASAYAARVTGS